MKQLNKRFGTAMTMTASTLAIEKLYTRRLRRCEFVDTLKIPVI